jgi:hypothetical protein
VYERGDCCDRIALHAPADVSRLADAKGLASIRGLPTVTSLADIPDFPT